jgi:hypothetical protein
MSAVVRIKDFRRRAPFLHFTRTELNRLLGLYASRVSRGEWRDYAIHHGKDAASFMVFASSQEQPQFIISKQARARGTERHYIVMSRLARLKSGATLDDVLSVFDRPIRLITG